MTLLTELSSLAIVAGVLFFALSRSAEKLDADELAVVGTSISLALKLTNIMTKLIKDCVEVEVGMRNTVVHLHTYLEKSL